MWRNHCLVVLAATATIGLPFTVSARADSVPGPTVTPTPAPPAPLPPGAPPRHTPMPNPKHVWKARPEDLPKAASAAASYWSLWEVYNNQTDTGKVMNAAKYGTSNGTKIIDWDWVKTDNERWILDYDGNLGSWKVRPKYATSLCLDMPAYTDTDGKQVQLYKCKSSGNLSNQRWDMWTDGNTYWIGPSYTGKIIAPEFSANGAPVVLTSDQRPLNTWHLYLGL